MDIEENCRALPQNCQFVNYETGLCLECEFGFRIDPISRLCTIVPSISNCALLHPENPSQCQLCLPNYYRSNGYTQCSPVSELCAKGLYDHNNGQCFACIEGAVLSQNGECRIRHCIEQTEDRCQMCKESFGLSADGKECNFWDANCETLG